MVVREGTYELGPDDGQLLIKTGRTGLGRRAGHDLTIEATAWTAAVEAREPLDGSSVEVTVEVDGLEAREGTGGVKALTDQDRSEIKKSLREVLDVRRYPRITFASTRIAPGEGSGDAEGGDGEIEGDLTIMGRVKPVRVRAVLESDGEGGRVRGGVTVTQSRWGIKPYSAFFGALRLADEVEIEFDLRLPA